MNKRDLIKALFKDPTIKALYESGHFNATDINRAILTEASRLNELTPKAATDATTRKTKGLSPTELLAALKQRMEVYEKAKQWVDLKSLHSTAARKDPETWDQWAGTYLETIKNNLGKKINNTENLVRQSQDADENNDGIPDNENTRKEIQDSTKEIVDQDQKDTETINQNIQNAGSEEGGAAGEVDTVEEAVAKLNELIGEKPALKNFLNNNKEFLEALAIAYVKALAKKGEESSTASAEPETSTASTEPEIATESIDRALGGIFLLENEENPQPSTDDEGGEPINVDDVPEVQKMIEELQKLFKSKNLSIPVEEIFKASQQKKGEKEDPAKGMEDVSPPELAEFQEAWTEQLQTFFGKNPNKSSFMRKLLLRDQANMLYTTISVLEQIEAGAQAGDDKKGQSAAYTKMNQDDEREKKSEKKEGLEEGPLGDSMKSASDSQFKDEEAEAAKDRLQKAQKDSMAQVVRNQSSTQPEQNTSQEQPTRPRPGDTVREIEIPPQIKRVIKQDLQAMVDLLRDVKKAIGNYKDYSTRNSVDPRFDGSKLKARLDTLLTQTQEGIFDLHSSLDILQTEPQGDDSLEEALSGIMLEKADPERKAKIELVEEVYMNAKQLYVKSLAVSMAPGTGQSWTKAKEEASNILEILKREDFIALFPTGMSTASGKIMTVTNAYDVMKGFIQTFIEIVRDIVLIAKTDVVSTTNIGRAQRQLKQISQQIQELFKIESKFSPEELRQAKQEEAEDEENQALTPVAQDNLEKSDDGSSSEEPVPEKAPLKIREKALEILKQKTGEDLSALKIFDIKAFASLLIFFMRSQKSATLQEEAEGKMISAQDLEKILTDEELKKEFDQVDNLFDGDLKKYVIRKYPSIKDTLKKAGKVPFAGNSKSHKELLIKLNLKDIRITAGLKDLGLPMRSALRLLAMAIIDAEMPSELPDEDSTETIEEASRDNQKRIKLLNYLRKLKVSEDIISSLSATMLKIVQSDSGEKKAITKAYKKLLDIEQIDELKLKIFIDILTKKVDKLKRANFIIKDKNNITSMTAAFKQYNKNKMEESLKPIIEEMLKEYYNH